MSTILKEGRERWQGERGRILACRGSASNPVLPPGPPPPPEALGDVVVIPCKVHALQRW